MRQSLCWLAKYARKPHQCELPNIFRVQCLFIFFVVWSVAIFSNAQDIDFDAQWEAYDDDIGEEGRAVLGVKVEGTESGRIWSDGRWDLDVELRAYSSGMQYGIQELVGSHDPANHPYVLFPEASVEWQAQTGVGIRAGSWIQHVGNSIMYNPVDIRIWPYGYRTFLDQNREPVTAGQIFMRSDAFEMKLTGVPWQSPSRLPLSESRWAVSQFDPENTMDLEYSGTIAASAHYKGQVFDGEVLLFHGKDPLPYLLPNEDSDLSLLRYADGDGIAAQAEFFFSSWVLRSESVAVWHSEDVDSLLQYVAGIEYRHPIAFSGWDLTCSVEYAGDDIFENGSLVEFPRPFSNALLSNLRLAKGLDMGFDFTYVDDLENHGALYSLSIDGNVLENCRASAKLDILQGDNTSFFGYYSNNDRLLLEATWRF